MCSHTGGDSRGRLDHDAQKAYASSYECVLIQAVIAGADWTMTHRKLSYATLCLTNIPGCELVATNRDRLVPAADGMKYPGTLPV